MCIFRTMYDEESAAENAPSECCRICDYNPCMCGRKDYVSEKEYRERLAEEMWRREEELENRGG